MTMTSAWPMIFTPATRTLRPKAARIAISIMPSIDPPSVLVLPVRDEYVRLARPRVQAVGRPHQLPPVEAELWEPIEIVVCRHLLETGAVGVDEEEIEIAAAWVLVVRRKDDPPPIGSEERGEVGAAQLRHLTLSASVGVHHPNLHLVRPHHLAP